MGREIWVTRKLAVFGSIVYPNYGTSIGPITLVTLKGFLYAFNASAGVAFLNLDGHC